MLQAGPSRCCSRLWLFKSWQRSEHLRPITAARARRACESGGPWSGNGSPAIREVKTRAVNNTQQATSPPTDIPGQTEPPTSGPTLEPPSSPPRLSYALAAATVLLTTVAWEGNVPLDELLGFWPGVMDGWAQYALRLATTSLLCYSWVHALGGALALSTGGAEAERVLGPGRFVLFFFLPGALKCVFEFFVFSAVAFDAQESGSELALVALDSAITEWWTYGPGAGLVGLAAAMAVVQLKNRKLLSWGQHRGWAAAQVQLAIVALAAEQQILGGGHVAAALLGGLLGWSLGPRWEASEQGADLLDRAVHGSKGGMDTQPQQASIPVSMVEVQAPARRAAGYVLAAAVAGGVLALTGLLEDYWFISGSELPLEPLLDPLLDGIKGFQA